MELIKGEILMKGETYVFSLYQGDKDEVKKIVDDEIKINKSSLAVSKFRMKKFNHVLEIELKDLYNFETIYGYLLFIREENFSLIEMSEIIPLFRIRLSREMDENLPVVLSVKRKVKINQIIEEV